jgi:hypothetical protein
MRFIHHHTAGNECRPLINAVMNPPIKCRSLSSWERHWTASSIHLSAMPNLQNDQSLSGPVYLIDDPIVTDTVFETPDPFFPLEYLVAQQFCVLPHPL